MGSINLFLIVPLNSDDMSAGDVDSGGIVEHSNR